MITYRRLGHVGRLGNALWEFASTWAIAQREGEEVVFPENWMHRPYFNLPDWLFGSIPDDAVEANEVEPGLAPYLQSFPLIRHELPVLREWLKPSELARKTLERIQFPPHPVIGIHVRRGDNVFDPGVPNKSDYHLCPDLSYYQRGLKHFNTDPRHLAVISDDIPWCKENIPADFYGNGVGHPKEHLPEFLTTQPLDWIDLFLLARCDYFVISGSTFGIWGVLLADVSPSHVVRPDRVYGPLVHADSELLFDPGWHVENAV
jgi:hypothetical protein